MLSTSTADRTPAERTRTRYRRIVYGLYAVGIVGLAAGFVLDRELVGSSVYVVGVWSGLLAELWIRRGSSVTFVDERDLELVRRASSYTIGAMAVVGLAVFPVLFVLDAAGRYTMGPTVAGALYVFSAVGLTVGAFCVALQLRS